VPYAIKKKDGKWCVQKKDGGRTLGCHTTLAAAKAQLAALGTSESARSDLRIEVPDLVMARAEFRPETAKAQQNGTLVVTLRVYAGAVVRRRAFVMGDYLEFDERLSFEPGAHRDGRLLEGRVPLIDNHDDFGSVREVVLGKIYDPVWDRAARTLDVQCLVSAKEELAGLRQDLLHGIVSNVSARYTVYAFRDVTAAGDAVRQLEAVDWETKEVSLVPVGADAGSSTRGNPRPTTVTVPLRRETMDPEILEEETTTAAAATTTATPATAPPVTAQRSEQAPAEDAAALERRRQTAVRARLQRAGIQLGEDFARGLLDGGRPADECSTMILEEVARRHEARSAHSGGNQVAVGEEQGSRVAQNLEDALLARGGRSDLISRDAAEVARRLQGNPFARRSLMECGERFLQLAHGVRREALDQADPMRRAAAILRARVHDELERSAAPSGMHSTTDFPGVLANITTKTLRSAFDLAGDTYSQWTTRGTLPDFKQAKRVQIGTAPRLLKKVEGAEYRYGTFGEQSEPILLATYGRIVAMTREMMVNDDLDAFMRVPRSYGLSARQLIADLVYAHLTGNTVMADALAIFHATHGNLVSAAGNAFTAANALAALSNTRVLARQQKAIAPGDGEAGFFASLDLVHLRVPEQLETVAQQVVAPIQSQQIANVNPFQGVFRSVMAEPRLGAASATAFYMFADPNLVDTVEVAFLQGEEGPVVDSRIGWERDGVEFRVRMDVGTSPIDFRGMYKNNGTA